jgi:hypothetical protein
MESDYPITHFELFDAGANLHDRPCQLVAEDLRRIDEPVLDFLDVRAADSAGGDAEEDFSLADFRNGKSLDNHAALPAIDAGAHLSAAGMWRLLRSDMCDCLTHDYPLLLPCRAL